MARGKTSKNTLTVRQKEALCLELRLQGHSLEEIAAAAGYRNESGPHKAILRILERQEKQTVETYIETELKRLDRLQVPLWAKAIAGNLQAIEQIRKLVADRRALLGLDAPRKQSIEATTSGTMEHSGLAIEDEILARVADLVMAATEEEPAVRERIAARLAAMDHAHLYG